MLASSCWRRQRRPSTLLPQKPCTVVMNMAFSIRLTATNMHSKSTIQNNNSKNNPKWQQQNMPNKIHAAAETRKLSKKKTKTENSLSSRWNATLGIANCELAIGNSFSVSMRHITRCTPFTSVEFLNSISKGSVLAQHHTNNFWINRSSPSDRLHSTNGNIGQSKHRPRNHCAHQAHPRLLSMWTKLDCAKELERPRPCRRCDRSTERQTDRQEIGTRKILCAIELNEP